MFAHGIALLPLNCRRAAWIGGMFASVSGDDKSNILVPLFLKFTVGNSQPGSALSSLNLN